MMNALSSFRIDPRTAVGIAAQIRTRIAFLIADGELTPGELLPPVRSLARQLDVSVNTVRSAYAKLEADGLVQTRHGVGTVVLAAPVERLRAGAGPLGVNTVAVLIGGLDPFYLSLLRGIEDVAAEQGTLVLIADTRDSPTLAEEMIRRLDRARRRRDRRGLRRRGASRPWQRKRRSRSARSCTSTSRTARDTSWSSTARRPDAPPHAICSSTATSGSGSSRPP